MALSNKFVGGEGLTEDRENMLDVEEGEEVESERLRLMKAIARTRDDSGMREDGDGQV